MILALALPAAAAFLMTGCGGSAANGAAAPNATAQAAAGVALSPTVATLQTGTTAVFTATLSGTTDPSVVWTVNGMAGGSSTVGTIASTGGTATYTAPATAGSYTIAASDTTHQHNFGSATVKVVAKNQVSVSLSPSSASLACGASASFTAAVNGSSNTAVLWSVDGVAGGNSAAGTLTGTGSTVTYTAPAVGGSHTVTATSAVDGTKSASASVAVQAPVSAPVSVSLAPGSASLSPGAGTGFTATVSGSSNTAVTWAVDGVSGGNGTVGTVSGTGPSVTYTAPSGAGSHTLVATSAADSSKSASAAISVLAAAVTASTSPSSATLNPGGTVAITATVGGTSNTAVTWTVDGVAGGSSAVGTIAGSGSTVTYTAPGTTGSHTVTATSAANATASATTSITVNAPASSVGSVAVSPATLALNMSAQSQFTATVTGTGSYSSSVTWSAQRGSITGSGLYTAPATGGNDVVTAASVQNPSVAGTASITVSGTLPVTVPTWAGTGVTHLVAAGGDIQAAINSANAGDTLTLADGTWTGVQLTINKRIRLMAVNPLGARLQGYTQPTNGTDNGITVTGSAAAGTFIQGLDVSWYGNCSIRVMYTGNVLVSGCKVESSGGDGIQLWDTVDVVVYENYIHDPYLAGMVPTLVDDATNTNWNFNNTLVLMDYGVISYGTVRTQVLQNYFYGQFNQNISFKEGNRDYTVQNNILEGFTGSGIICGQNLASYGPYAYSGQPVGNDTGTLHIVGNIFRPVVGLQLGQLAEYRAGGAIRMGHLNQATVYVSSNIVEAAITPLGLEMGMNGSAGGPTGTLYSDHNIFNGNIWDDGTMVSPTAKIRHVGNWRAVLLDSGVQMNVVITNDTYANFSYAVENDGMTGTLAIDRTLFITNTIELMGTGSVTNSIFYPNSALPGTGNVAENPLVSTTTVPLRRYSLDVLVPTSDLASRFHPGLSSPALLTDGTYVGAVAP